jgi:hypothetical protein
MILPIISLAILLIVYTSTNAKCLKRYKKLLTCPYEYINSCRAGLPILKQEFDTLKNKLGAYLKVGL